MAAPNFQSRLLQQSEELSRTFAFVTEFMMVPPCPDRRAPNVRVRAPSNLMGRRGHLLTSIGEAERDVEEI